MRAVVLALIAAHYLHTAGDHALSMLQTCEQLATGLGAPAVKGTMPGPTGNLRLCLWVGQKYLGTCCGPLRHMKYIDGSGCLQSCIGEPGRMRGCRSK